MTLLEFAEKCEKGGLAVEEQALFLQKAVSGAILKELLILTPVDTGRARANWQTRSIEATDEIKYPQPDKPSSPEAAVEEAKQMFRDEMKDHTDGPIHITNNVPYIDPLNRGTSSQQPAGFIERAIQTAEIYVKEKTKFNPFQPDVKMKWDVID